MRTSRLALRNDGASQRIVKASRARESNDTFEMANLYPRETGLPMTVWISPRGRARHDARIKVCLSAGDRMDASNTAVVAIRPQPRLVRGDMPSRDFQLVAQWIEANAAALIEYWEGALGTVEFAMRMQRLPNATP
jgi:hypothetical protein